MKETHVILHRPFLKNMHGTFFPYFVSGCAYLRVTARREKQNHIVSEPDIEPGLSPATDSQVLEVAQAVAKHESEAGQRAISCAKQWNDWPVCFCLSVFVWVLLLLVRLEVLGSLLFFSIQVFSVSSFLESQEFETGVPRLVSYNCFHFHNCLDRRYVSVSLATFDWVCCWALLLSLAFNTRRIASIAFRKSYKQLMSRHSFCNVLL